MGRSGLRLAVLVYGSLEDFVILPFVTGLPVILLIVAWSDRYATQTFLEGRACGCAAPGPNLSHGDTLRVPPPNEDCPSPSLALAALTRGTLDACVCFVCSAFLLPASPLGSRWQACSCDRRSPRMVTRRATRSRLRPFSMVWNSGAAPRRSAEARCSLGSVESR